MRHWLPPERIVETPWLFLAISGSMSTAGTLSLPTFRCCCGQTFNAEVPKGRKWKHLPRREPGKQLYSDIPRGQFFCDILKSEVGKVV